MRLRLSWCVSCQHPSRPHCLWQHHLCVCLCEETTVIRRYPNSSLRPCIGLETCARLDDGSMMEMPMISVVYEYRSIFYFPNIFPLRRILVFDIRVVLLIVSFRHMSCSRDVMPWVSLLRQNSHHVFLVCLGVWCCCTRRLNPSACDWCPHAPPPPVALCCLPAQEFLR